MYIRTKEQIEEDRRKYKSDEDYLEQMKEKFKKRKKEIKFDKSVNIDNLKGLLKRNITVLIEYSNLKNITKDYIDSLSNDEVRDLMKIYQESLMRETEELIKKGELRKSFLD